LFQDASWINVDVGYEWRFKNQFLIRPYAGVSQLVASTFPVWRENGSIQADAVTFPDYSRSRERWPRLYYVGVALGFDI
jgi:hypothetical protein